LNEALLAKAVEARVVKTGKVRADTTVVSANVETGQQGNQAQGPGRGHLPQRRRRDPPRRRDPGRHARRVAIRRAPLPLRRVHGHAQTHQRYWHHRRDRQRRVDTEDQPQSPPLRGARPASLDERPTEARCHLPASSRFLRIWQLFGARIRARLRVSETSGHHAMSVDVECECHARTRAPVEQLDGTLCWLSTDGRRRRGPLTPRRNTRRERHVRDRRLGTLATRVAGRASPALSRHSQRIGRPGRGLVPPGGGVAAVSPEVRAGASLRDRQLHRRAISATSRRSGERSAALR